MLPIILLGLTWWRRGRIERRHIAMIAPFFALSAASACVTSWFQYKRGIVDWIIPHETLSVRIIAAGKTLWFYVLHALAPVNVGEVHPKLWPLPMNLMMVYPRWKTANLGLIDALPLAAFILLAAAVVALWRVRPHWGKPALLALGCFVLSLVPVLAIVPLGYMRHSFVADHLQYLALMVVVAFVSAMWGLWHGRAKRKAWPVAVAAVLMAGLAVQTFFHARTYSTGLRMWRDNVRKNPNSWVAWNNLSEMVLDDDPDEALVCAQKAPGPRPQAGDAHQSRHRLLHTGKEDLAEPYFREAIQLDGNMPSPGALCNLAIVLLRKAGKLKQAGQGRRSGQAPRGSPPNA